MNIRSVLLGLAQQGISLQVSGTKLIVKGDIRSLGAETKQFLKKNKNAIIDYIQARHSLVDYQPITALSPIAQKPLSFAQQRLFFIDQLHGGATSLYNIPFALEVEGTFDLALAECALRAIVDRHQVLRTNFVSTPLGPKIVFHDAAREILEKVDLSHLGDAQQTERVRQLERTAALKPFNLNKDLMLRGIWIKLNFRKGILLLSVHHIAADGWSIPILVREFIYFYRSLRRELKKTNSTLCDGQEDCPPKLPLLSIQYSDFSAWQHNHLTGVELERHLAYWKRQLHEAPVVHSLPLDFDRPQMRTSDGAIFSHCLDKSSSKAFDSLARQLDVTPFMLLHAAFVILLSRHSGISDDIVIGTPVANRQRIELEPLIGCFVNTLVLRASYMHDMPFTEYLDSIKQINLDALEHQDIPFELLADQLQVSRSVRHEPLFQIMLSMNTIEQEPLVLEELRVVPLVTSEETAQAKFDLTLNVSTNSVGMSLTWIYATELFKRETVANLSRHLQNLLNGIVAAPKTVLARLPMLTTVEFHQLVHEYNRVPDAAFSKHSRPLDIELTIFAQVERFPEAIAVRSPDGELTYRELQLNVMHLTKLLREQSAVKKGDTVAIYCDRSSEMVVAMLTCLSLGIVFVPLDPVMGLARLEYALSDSKIGLILTRSQWISSICHFDVVYKCLDQILNGDNTLDWSEETAKDVTSSHQIDDRAYILYTSGSTGVPKGVAVGYTGLLDYLSYSLHRYYTVGSQYLTKNASSLLRSVNRETRFTENVDRMSSLIGSYVMTSHSFDLSIPSIWLPLMSGGVVEFAPSSEEIESLCRLCLDKRGPFLLRMTPFHVEGLLSLLPSRSQCNQAHVFVIGGAVFQTVLADRLQHYFPCAQIFNHYGPTETTVGCSLYDASAHLRLSSKKSEALPIGSPMGDTQLYVLGPGCELVPRGSIGELYIGGAGVAQEYVNKPVLTNERFVLDPYSGAKTNALLYRSGDLVRYLVNGNLEFIDRIDNQVKILGYRIELGEIEYQLNQLAAVQSSLVLARCDSLGSQRLIAYVLPIKNAVSSTSNESDDRIQLHSLCQQELEKRLPPYMVPHTYLLVESWPLTSNGKIEKSQLPLPFPKVDYGQKVHVLAQTDLERLLVTIWSGLLDIPLDGLSTTANFFSNGGDSLKVLKLIACAREKGLELQVRDVFEHQTIAELAVFVARTQHQKNLTGYNLDPTQGSKGSFEKLEGDNCVSYPLTPMQRIIIHNYRKRNRNSSEGIYHVQTVTRFAHGTVCVENLKKAVEWIFLSTSILKTRIVKKESKYVQLIDDTLSIAFRELYVSESMSEAETELEALVVSDRADSFVIPNEKPLLRFTFAYSGKNLVALIFSIHHAIIDGWSSSEITNHLVTAYEKLQAGKPLERENDKNVFRELAMLYEKTKFTGELRTFWVRQLQEMKHFRLSEQTDQREDGFPCPLVKLIPGPKQLQMQIQIASVSIRALYSHALLLTMFEWTNQACNTIGVVVNGRRDTLSNPLQGIGLFWNMLPLVFNPDSWTYNENQSSAIGDKSIGNSRTVEELQRVHDKLLAMETHSITDATELNQEFGTQLFFATLNYMDFHNRSTLNTRELKILNQTGHDKLHYPLNFAIHPVKDGVEAEARVDYDTRFFCKTQVDHLLNLFVERLRRLAN